MTLFPRRDTTEEDLARVLEQEFEAGWFPKYHRCSIATGDATVYVDFDPAYVSRLTSEEQRSLGDQLGYVPKIVIHVHGNTSYPGTTQMVEHVSQVICRLLDGRALVAA